MKFKKVMLMRPENAAKTKIYLAFYFCMNFPDLETATRLVSKSWKFIKNFQILIKDFSLTWQTC